MKTSTTNYLPPAGISALTTLDIPDAVPVPYNDEDSDIYGVGIGAINGGLVVFVEAYSNMALGDKIEVFWGSPSVAVATETVTALNVRVVLKIAESTFRDGSFQPFYRLTRISGLVENASAREILVKLNRPGGIDPDPTSPENENLARPGVPADVERDGVDAERARQGVEISIAPYQGMAVNDRIIFYWGGAEHVHLVVAGQVNRTVYFTITEAEILQAGDGRIQLVYQVIDAAENRSNGPWSLMRVVDVSASGDLLDEPEVLEAVNDIIDLNTLSTRDATAEVYASRADFAMGDIIELFWQGVDSAGKAVNYSVRQLVNKAPPSRMDIPVPNRIVQATAQGHAKVYYALDKGTGNPKLSRSRNVSITGNISKLPKPLVPEQIGGVIPYDLAQASVQVMPYIGMAVNDTVAIVWSGHRADGSLTDYRDARTLQAADVGSVVSFTIPAIQISTLAGGSVEVSYSVNGLLASEVLPLSVSQQTNLYPPPFVTENQGGVIDGTVKEANVIIPTSTSFAMNDRVELVWTGNLSGRYTDAVTVLVVGNPLLFHIPASAIAGNNTITVQYNVTRNSVTTGSQVLPLSVKNGNFPNLPLPEVPEALNNTLPAGQLTATLRIPASAQLQQNDTLRLRWAGQPGAGTPTIPDIVITQNQAGRLFDYPIAAAVVAGNRGHTVTLDYSVIRANGGVQQDSGTFSLNVEEGIAPPASEGFDGVRNGKYTSLNRPQMTITSTSEFEVDDRYTEYPPFMTGSRMVITGRTPAVTVTFRLDREATSVSFGANTWSGRATISAWDLNGLPIGSIDVDTTLQVWTLQAPAGQLIRSFSARVSETLLFIDNIVINN